MDIRLNTVGHKCPQPIIEVSSLGIKGVVGPGDMVTVISDCENFETMIRQWCAKVGKTLIYARPLAGTRIEVQIQW